MEVRKIRVCEIRGLKAMASCYFFIREKLLTAITLKIGKVREVQQEKISHSEHLYSGSD